MAEIYRHYNKDNELLYVGVSLNAILRLIDHRLHAQHFNQITKITIERFPTRADALAAEPVIILLEKPKFNRVFNGDRRYEIGDTLTEDKNEFNILELASFIGVTRRTASRMITEGRFPVKHVKGSNPRIWLRSDCELWLAGKYKS